jgi:hypothetical protein
MTHSNNARARRRPAVPPRPQIALDITNEDVLELAMLSDRNRGRATRCGRITAEVLA